MRWNIGFLRREELLLRGTGKVVEIDECKIGKRKFKRGSHLVKGTVGGV